MRGAPKDGRRAIQHNSLRMCLCHVTEFRHRNRLLPASVYHVHNKNTQAKALLPTAGGGVGGWRTLNQLATNIELVLYLKRATLDLLLPLGRDTDNHDSNE